MPILAGLGATLGSLLSGAVCLAVGLLIAVLDPLLPWVRTDIQLASHRVGPLTLRRWELPLWECTGAEAHNNSLLLVEDR